MKIQFVYQILVHHSKPCMDAVYLVEDTTISEPATMLSSSVYFLPPDRFSTALTERSIVYYADTYWSRCKNPDAFKLGVNGFWRQANCLGKKYKHAESLCTARIGSCLNKHDDTVTDACMLESNKDEILNILKEWTSKFIVIDGHLFKACSKPRYVVKSSLQRGANGRTEISFSTSQVSGKALEFDYYHDALVKAKELASLRGHHLQFKDGDFNLKKRCTDF